MVQYQCSCTYFSHAAPSYIISPQLRMCVHLYARVIWCAVHTADFIDFHRDMTQAPLYLFTSYLKFGPLSHTCTHTYIHAYIHTCTTPLLPPPALLILRAETSLSWGLCCGATGECHLTNEFLLTSRSPLKNLFVLLQQHAELPCSCLCSQTQVLVLYIPVLFVLRLPASHALSSETLSCHIAFLMCFCSCVLLIVLLVFPIKVVEFVKSVWRHYCILAKGGL